MFCACRSLSLLPNAMVNVKKHICSIGRNCIAIAPNSKKQFKKLVYNVGKQNFVSESRCFIFGTNTDSSVLFIKKINMIFAFHVLQFSCLVINEAYFEKH